MFKKKDIIPGRHFIKTYSGDYYVAFTGADDELYFVSNTGFLHGNGYDENLQMKEESDSPFNVVEIWEFRGGSYGGGLNRLLETAKFKFIAKQVWPYREVIPIGGKNYYEDEVIDLLGKNLKPVDHGGC